MGTERKLLGYVIIVKPYRKHGNGAKGGGRKGSTGKECFLYQINDKSERMLVASAKGPTATDAMKGLRSLNSIIPTSLAIKKNEETYF